MGNTTFVTFYSYKGGVGRTLSLGNVAWEAARNGKKVVIIDFDLEAPGISSIIPFQETIKRHFANKKKKGGLFEFILEFQQTQKIPSLASHYSTEPIIEKEFKEGGSLRIIPAGREDVAYKEKLQAFNWARFYDEENGKYFLNDLRPMIISEFDHPDLVLIDSRTGLTDIGGICTILLPDKVVIFTGLNDQNLKGSKSVIDTIEEHSRIRLKINHLRPIEVILVASHVPETEDLDKRGERLERAKKLFGREIDLTLPYVPILSLEEKVLIQEERSNRENANLMVKQYVRLYLLVSRPSFYDDMALVPAGTFYCGSQEDDKTALDNEKPQKRIELPGYFMDLYPVTNEQFCEFLNRTQPDYNVVAEWIRLENAIIERCRIARLDDGKYVIEKGYEAHPVTHVTWFGAEVYAKWAEKRLPTENEWEKAARGVDGRVYPWGNEFDVGCANTDEGKRKGTTSIGSFPKGNSPYGCSDLAGNVWEWTLGSREGEKILVLRGGSWNYNRRYCRCAFRKGELPFNCGPDIGFRCVKS